MIYDEVGSGGAVAMGCVFVGMLHPSVTSFGIGDTVYNVQKAHRGVLEKVVIKAMRTVQSRRTGGVRKVLYEDTLNGLWNEYDLVPFERARDLAEVFWQNVANQLTNFSGC